MGAGTVGGRGALAFATFPIVVTGAGTPAGETERTMSFETTSKATATFVVTAAMSSSISMSIAPERSFAFADCAVTAVDGAIDTSAVDCPFCCVEGGWVVLSWKGNVSEPPEPLR